MEIILLIPLTYVLIWIRDENKRIIKWIHLKLNNSENRAIQRHEIQLIENRKLRDEVEDLRDEFEKVRALILCAHANDENDWRNNALNGAITKTPSNVQVRRLYKFFK